jgi:hypothetical protein
MQVRLIPEIAGRLKIAGLLGVLTSKPEYPNSTSEAGILAQVDPNLAFAANIKHF